MIDIPDAVYEAAWNAAFPGLPAGMDTAESVRRVRAAVNVAWPLAVAAGRAEAAADIRALDVERIARLEGNTARVGLTVAARIAERRAA